MKNLLPLTSAAAFAAFLILPVDAEILGSLFFASSLGLVLSGDYGRRFRPLRRQPVKSPSCESLRLAA